MYPWDVFPPLALAALRESHSEGQLWTLELACCVRSTRPDCPTSPWKGGHWQRGMLRPSACL